MPLLQKENGIEDGKNTYYVLREKFAFVATSNSMFDLIN
jgi:hypothetical protein